MKINEFKYVKLFLIFCIGSILLLPACNFVKVSLIPIASKSEFEKLQKKDRIYILHIGKDRFLLEDIKIEDKFITGIMDSIPSDTIFHIPVKGTSLPIYIPKHKKVIKIVNIHVSEFVKDQNSIMIPYQSIKRMDVYSKEPNMAATGYFFIGQSVGLLFFLVLSIILAIMYGG